MAKRSKISFTVDPKRMIEQSEYQPSSYEAEDLKGEKFQEIE